MDNWWGINEFVAVVETASFTKAAKQLSTSVAQVSRKVASLEKRLSSKLLLRTTRKVTVTEAGSRYYKRIGRKRPSFKIVQSFIANDKANKALKSQC